MDYIIVAFIGILSFAMQLLATKDLLPQLGGSASVWIGSLMFFQMALFLSYTITNFLIKGNKELLNKLVLLSWLINSLGLLLGFKINTSWPILNQIIILFTNYGFIFMALLMISPYLQITSQKRALDFYVFSNLGAMIGLLGYPLIVEPFLGLQSQKFFLILISGLIFIWFIFKVKIQFSSRLIPLSRDKKNKVLQMSALGTILLGSFSSALIQDIISFPLFWVLPLVLYLLGFIWAFSSKVLGQNFFEKNSLTLLEIVFLILIAGFSLGNWLNILISLICFGLIIFIVQLYLSKQAPEHKNQLPSFYYLVGLGGLIGGIVVNLIIPLIFIQVNEYLFFILVTYFVVLFLEKRKLSKYLAAGVIVLLFTIIQLYKSSFVLEAQRGYYGLIKIIEQDSVKSMMHGQIVHGQENLNSMGTPNTYYQPNMVNQFFSHRPQKTLIIGLGAGVLLHYLDKDQEVDIIEIDPIVVNLAKKHFSYINSSPAKINIIIGDGRKVLESLSKNYDLIIVDAFSGDAIPTHLLTLEAFEIYRSKLTNQGIVGVHLSNNYLQLAQIVYNTAHNAGLTGEVKPFSQNSNTAIWGYFKPAGQISKNINNYWTDDYNSLLKIIKW